MIQSSPYYPTLTGSSHIVRVRAYDTVGNFSETVIYYPPVVNIIAPTVLKNSPITNTTIQVVSSTGDTITAVTFSGAGNSGFDCGILPALAPVICTSGSISTSGILEVSASNGGFTGKSTQTYIIDTDRPTAVISLSGSATNPTTQTIFSLRITTSEALSGSLSGLFSLINATISGMSIVDSTNTIFTITAISDGLVSVVLPDSVITDLAGNQNFVSNTLSRTVDTTAPTVPTTTASPNPANATILVNITTGLVESGATVSIPGTTCSPSPSTGATVTCTGSGVNIGSNPTITITDPAGNSATGTVILIVDTIAPTTPTPGLITPNPAKTGDTVTLPVINVESGATISIPNMVCSPSPATASGTVSCTATAGTGVGQFAGTVETIIVIDTAGNTNTSAITPILTIDDSIPLVPTTTASPNPANATILVNITTGLVESGATVSIPGTTCSPSPSTGATVTCTGSGVNIGSNPTITITDPAGNSATGTVILIVDTIAPDTLLVATGTNISSGGTITSSTASIAFTSTETGSTFQCSLDA